MSRTISMLALALTLAGSGVAFAQTDAAPTKPVSRAGTRTVKDVLGRIEAGAGTGVRIVADSSVAGEYVPLPSGATTPENMEAQITAVVDALPKGTAWAKIYLPEAGTRAYKGDDLAEYVLAQAKLFGGKVGAAPDGSVELLGKIVPADKAQAVIDALNLKPVYLLTNPNLKAVAGGDLQSWATLTDEQKAEYAKNEAAKRLAMGPDAFAKQFSTYMMQQGAVMQQMFGQMTPDQRDAYGQAMRNSFQTMGGGGMGMMFGGGGGGRPGGGRGNRGGGQVAPQR